MTPLSFGQRMALRRLQQTAERNIVRRHQARFESTGTRNASTSVPPEGQTIPTAAWPWFSTLTTPFRAYGNMQKRRPLLTQWESTMIIYFLGDLSAQTVGSSGYTEGSYEPARGLRALIIAAICSIPAYKWFLFLGRNFNYKYHWQSISVKIVINQMCFTPVFNTYFFGMQSLLSGCTWDQTVQRIKDTVPVSFINSWKVWPVVTAFSFTYISPQNRSVFAGSIAIVWQTYLSWLNKQAEQKEGQSKQIEAREQVLEEKMRKMVAG